jgi:hypothetical protein
LRPTRYAMRSSQRWTLVIRSGKDASHSHHESAGGAVRWMGLKDSGFFP